MIILIREFEETLSNVEPPQTQVPLLGNTGLLNQDVTPDALGLYDSLVSSYYRSDHVCSPIVFFVFEAIKILNVFGAAFRILGMGGDIAQSEFAQALQPDTRTGCKTAKNTAQQPQCPSTVN